MNRKIIIAGAYGLGNVGDEAVLSATLAHFCQNNDTVPIVLSYNPQETSRLHQVNSIHFLNPAVLFHLTTTKTFIQGGGGILDNRIAGIRNNLSRYLIICCLICKLLGKEIFFHRIGFYSFGNAFYNFLLKAVLKGSNISCRDKRSYENLKKLGLKSRIILENDAALELDPIKIPEKIINEWKAHFPGEKIKKRIGLSVRYVSDKAVNDRTKKIFQGLIDELADDFDFFFLIFQEHKIKKIENDLNTAHEIIGNRNIEIIKDLKHPYDVLAVLNFIDLMIAMRLHANILSYINGNQLIPISYHDKVLYFFDQVGSTQEVLDLNTFTKQKLKAMIYEKI